MYRKLPCFVSYLENDISFYRAKYGFTQQYIAELFGVSINTVSSWETLEFVPSLKHALDLASLFRVPVEELFHRVCYFQSGNHCLDCDNFSDAGCLLQLDPFDGPWSCSDE